MNIFDTMTALFSGERVSHTDTFILAGVVLALFVGIRTLSQAYAEQRLNQGSSVNAGGLFHIMPCSDVKPYE
jgi:hypothetical protein